MYKNALRLEATMSLDKEDNGASFSSYCSNWSIKMTRMGLFPA